MKIIWEQGDSVWFDVPLGQKIVKSGNFEWHVPAIVAGDQDSADDVVTVVVAKGQRKWFPEGLSVKVDPKTLSIRKG